MTQRSNNIKGMLLDLDGTLLDHVDAIRRCYQYAADQLGTRSPTADEVRRAIGGSMPVAARKLIPPEFVERGIELWREHFEAIHLEGVVLLPGSKRLLDTLIGQNISGAVFTNKIGRHSRSICDNEGLSSKLKFVLGAEDTAFRKPQIEYSQHAIEKLGTQASETVMMGDSPFDIEAAKCVGMISWVVPTGSHSAAELEEAGADRVFTCLNAVADTLLEQAAMTA